MKRQLAIAFLLVSLTGTAAFGDPINTVSFGNLVVVGTPGNTTILHFSPPNGAMTASGSAQSATIGTYYYSGHTPTTNAGVGAGTATASGGVATLTTTETNGGGTQYLDMYPAGAIPFADLFLSFDLGIGTNPGPVQPGSESDLFYNGAAFGINIFADGASAARFIAAPTSLTGGIFGLSQTGLNAGVANLGAPTPYLNGQTYAVQIHLDFVNRDATLSVDGNDVGTIDFRNPAAGTTLSEVFAYQVGYEGIQAVPDPGTTFVLLGGALGILVTARQRWIR